VGYYEYNVGCSMDQPTRRETLLHPSAPPRNWAVRPPQMIRAPAQLYRGDRFCPPAISPPCAELPRDHAPPIHHIDA
jgi:hypothetical protein